jgi:lipopolysaccharide/colanic/teichoic acid biosynthesis glycosyltransferase
MVDPLGSGDAVARGSIDEVARLGMPSPSVRRGAKRCIDVVVAAAALLALSPLIAITALAILMTDGRPILFRQRRPGRGGAPFTIVKFRTMRAPRPGEAWYRTDDERVTRLGRLLRTTSLDELPELWNVLRGEMSLVGPRPLLMEYLAVYTPAQARRHDVKPGITGWAIIHGRNDLSFADRLALDTWYVDHWSLRLDARILLATVGQVLRRSGATPAQDVDRLGFPLPPSGQRPDERDEP